MKRETITRMLNSIEDDYISEAEVFCPDGIQKTPERIVHMKKRIIMSAIAAVLMLALGVTAGMAVGTLALLFVVPVFFMVFQRWHERFQGKPVEELEVRSEELEVK